MDPALTHTRKLMAQHPWLMPIRMILNSIIFNTVRLGIYSVKITQKRFHGRYNFGYGILLSIRKMPYFCPFTAHFSGFEGVFSHEYIVFMYKQINPPLSAPWGLKRRILYRSRNKFTNKLFYIEKCDYIIIS